MLAKLIKLFLIFLNSYKIFYFINKKLVLAISWLTLRICLIHKQVYAILLKESVVKDEFYPFYSDLDFVLVLKAVEDRGRFKTLKKFFIFFNKLSKINPLLSDRWQLMIFNNEANVIKEFWYLFHGISSWSLFGINSVVRDKQFWLNKNEDFLDGNKQLLLTGNWSSLCSWYEASSCNIFTSHYNAYRTLKKVNFFTNRINSFAHLPDKFKYFEYLNSEQALKAQKGFNGRLFEEVKKSEQIENLIQTFHLIKKTSALISQKCKNNENIISYGPLAEPYKKGRLLNLDKDMDFSNADFVFLAPRKYLYIITKQDINNDELLGLMHMAKSIYNKKNMAVCVYPNEAYPYLFINRVKKVIYSNGTLSAGTISKLIKHQCIYEALYARNYLNISPRIKDAYVLLRDLFFKFLQTKILLHNNYFCADEKTLFELCRKIPQMHKYNEIIDSLPDMKVEKLFNVNLQLQKDFFDHLREVSGSLD